MAYTTDDLSDYGFSIDDIESSLYEPEPQYQPQPVPQHQPPQPTEERKLAPFLLKLLQQHYKLIFWLAVVPAFVLGVFLSLPKQQERYGEVVTPLAPETKQQELQFAVDVINDKPIADANGQLRPATANEIFAAAKKVMSWQEDQLVQKAVTELNVAINVGLGTPTHQCYRMTVATCLDQRLQVEVDRRRQEAIASNNLDELLKLDQLNRVYDRIRQGDIYPAQYAPDLYTLARAKYLASLDFINRNGTNGQAAAALQLQMQQRAAGQVYNPATGQMERAN